MKHVAVHHLHVKYKGEIFTVYHDAAVISLHELQRLINEIKDIKNETPRA